VQQVPAVFHMEGNKSVMLEEKEKLGKQDYDLLYAVMFMCMTVPFPMIVLAFNYTLLYFWHRSHA